MFKVGTGGEIHHSHQKEHKQIYPQQGWVEHDPEEIYKNCVDCIENCIEHLDEPSQLKGFGITNQRETTLVWDKNTGKPLHNAIVWLDTRTQSVCNEFSDRNAFKYICGLPVSTYFSGMKLKWMIDNVPAVKSALDEGTGLFGTIDSWLLWKLTGGPDGGVHATDVTNASRTMLMNIHTGQWDKDMCEVLGVPMSCLPEIRSSCETYGHYKSKGPREFSMPICSILGDQQAALVGQGCFKEGQSKNTYGTGCFFMSNVGEKPVFSKNGLLTTVGYKAGPNKPMCYALEGSVAVAGACVQWLRDNLQIIEGAPEVELYASEVEDTGGMYFVPAFSGLFAPHWREDARGAMVGMTMYTNKRHVCRAAIEAICYQVSDVIDAAEADSGIRITKLKVDGGAAANNLMMQFQSDLLEVEVVRPKMLEITALGVEFFAGLSLGIYKDFNELLEIADNAGRNFHPTMTEEVRKVKKTGWNKAIEKSLGWVDDETKAKAEEL
ncbi:glycerol kinase [Sphaeroforma arctica JP610]|uniref:glycerol kinase n=1 Tax=Sphaeroforma arctica JP610 TaxID=667725 RepID=A0A0L0G289_9EUKA|nr:glycerol kinase [Sphaeroforma arctica JP610]KNC83185.1 glycerol kinase [Sphaeroforma arctica JP610]|eukprot:XP_014157087.1 glycerol kinase [Sphaeroforma arctica JP610]